MGDLKNNQKIIFKRNIQQILVYNIEIIFKTFTFKDFIKNLNIVIRSLSTIKINGVSIISRSYSQINVTKQISTLLSTKLDNYLLLYIYIENIFEKLFRYWNLI